MDPEHKVFNEEYVIKRILIDQNMRNKNYINEDRTSIDPKTSNIFDAPVRALDYSMIVFDDKKAEV